MLTSIFSQVLQPVSSCLLSVLYVRFLDRGQICPPACSETKTKVKELSKGIHQEGHDTERTAGVEKASERERLQEERSNRERRDRHSVVNLAREIVEAQASTTRGRLTPNKKCTENKIKKKNIIITCSYNAPLLPCTYTNADDILNKRTELT